MDEVLNRYFFQRKSISIPGLGSLVAESIPAITDFANRQIVPVQQKIRFDKYFDAPEKDFFNYLSAQKSMPDFEAIRWYNEFAADLCNRIRSGETVKWPGVGLFKKDFGGDIVFESDWPAFELYPAVRAERVIRRDASHSIRVGDQEKTNYEMSQWLSDDVQREKAAWWIYAVIIAAAALLVLFFHSYRQHLRWGFSGNQQHIEIGR